MAPVAVAYPFREYIDPKHLDTHTYPDNKTLLWKASDHWVL